MNEHEAAIQREYEGAFAAVVDLLDHDPELGLGVWNTEQRTDDQRIELAMQELWGENHWADLYWPDRLQLLKDTVEKFTPPPPSGEAPERKAKRGRRSSATRDATMFEEYQAGLAAGTWKSQVEYKKQKRLTMSKAGLCKLLQRGAKLVSKTQRS